MRDDKKPVAKTETPNPRAPAEAAPLRQAEKAPISLLVPRNDRILASAGYLSAFGGFWLVVPGMVYIWNGRQSRFLGFHAVQAVLLQVALIPITFIGLGVATALEMWIAVATGDRHGSAPLAALAFFAVVGLAVMLPSAATVWMGMCALRGQPRALPLLGRWARKVVGEPGEA